MVPKLEDKVKLYYIMAHNRPRLTYQEDLILGQNSGKLFVESNYDLWKTEIERVSTRGYQQPDRLAARVMLKTTCTRGNERSYHKIIAIGNGRFIESIEKEYLKELEGLEPGERTDTIMLNAVTLLAKYFVNLFYQREIRDKSTPVPSRATNQDTN